MNLIVVPPWLAWRLRCAAGRRDLFVAGLLSGPAFAKIAFVAVGVAVVRWSYILDLAYATSADLLLGRGGEGSSCERFLEAEFGTPKLPLTIGSL